MKSHEDRHRPLKTKSIKKTKIQAILTCLCLPEMRDRDNAKIMYVNGLRLCQSLSVFYNPVIYNNLCR
ncbi:hypothetical protein EUGRSUZ_I02061 [Eucalyptus grandis]|uniref:Uncharacterized protein n=2 Tax=Eucalyptus grandis TaxID=71139 RepID=A0ACC3JHZ3_EUCGR|nr:hypothetical protein EUGRSUZ_I02061 [Eucalyptus grandis]